MKISSVSIQNFRSIKELSVDFPERGLLVLVGPNNAGKSNFLRAINAVLGDGWVSGERLEDYDFYQRDRENIIEVDISFDNGRNVIFKSDAKWPTYHNKDGYTIFSKDGNVKDDFPCTYIPANRSLDSHLQFKRWSLMGKISHAFQSDAKSKKQEIEQKFNEVMDTFNSIDSFNEFKTDFVGYFKEMQADTPYKLKIDFKAFTPNDYLKTINIVAEDPELDGYFDVDELGEGTRNVVLLALIRSYAKNFRNDAQGILAIEEPEIFMHPQARRHLYKIFKEIISNSNIQIILTTHSASFVDPAYFDTIGKVYKVPDIDGLSNTKIKMVGRRELVDFAIKTGVPKTKTTVNNIKEYYRTTSNYRLNEAFFSKFLILVEGETEELALPVYLNHLGIDCDLRGISIIAVNGKNQMPKYWRLFKNFKIPMLVLFDSDDSNEKKNSNINVARCFNCSVEDIVNVEGSYKIIESQNAGIFNQKLMILKTDFESALNNDWIANGFDIDVMEIHENKAKELIKPLKNQQKGQIARFIATKLTSKHNYAPSFVHELKNILTNYESV